MATIAFRTIPAGAPPDPLPWSADECVALRYVASRIIPADARRGIPGADDAMILMDMLATAGPDRLTVGAALRQLDGMAAGNFAVLDGLAQDTALRRLQVDDPGTFTALAGLVMRCYYRDTRVMHALGMEPRPPYPKGFDVDTGDWSLLDPVRNRAKQIFRDAG
jgi:hypothetical protein